MHSLLKAVHPAAAVEILEGKDVDRIAKRTLGEFTLTKPGVAGSEDSPPSLSVYLRRGPALFSGLALAQNGLQQKFSHQQWLADIDKAPVYDKDGEPVPIYDSGAHILSYHPI